MSYGWKAWSLFGAGALFGLIGGAVLYAPPELGNQPPPWQRWASDHGDAAAATHMAGAGPAQAAAPAPMQATCAAPSPLAAASAPAAVEQVPVAVEAAAPAQAVASAPEPVKVAKVHHTPAPRKPEVQNDEPAVDTTSAGAGPAPQAMRVQPEPISVPAESAPPRAEGASADSAQ